MTIKMLLSTAAAALIIGSIGVAHATGSPRPDTTDQSKVRGSAAATQSARSGQTGSALGRPRAFEGSGIETRRARFGNAHMNWNFEVGRPPGDFTR